MLALKVNNSRFVGLRAMADGSLLRAATLHDKPYLVVPIISAVGDKVWWPANSATPELVPAGVLEAGYWSRNNRPIVAGHPKVNGEYVSANSPEILEKYSFGHLFAAEFDNKRVKVEAWFDKERAIEVGPVAVDVITRLENGEQIEVSEGNMVISEPKEGELDGKPYKSVWLSCVNDHLATVSEGACNNQMGCGGPRVNQQNKSKSGELSVASSFKEVGMKDSDKKSFFARLFGSALNTLKSAMSNNELRMKLYRAIEQVDQGVMYVDDEDIETKTFRYCVVIRYGDYWDYEQMEHHYYQRSFSTDDSGNVTVGNDRTEVEWFEGWRDKATQVITESELTAATSDRAEPSCSCHSQTHEKGKEITTVNANEKKALIIRLIEAKKSPFDETDRGVLEGMKDEKLTSMLSAYEGTETTTTDTTPMPTPVAVAPITTTTTSVETSSTVSNSDQVTLSKEEYEEIKASSNAHKAQQEQYRSTLVSSLKSAQSAFTEDDMKVMTTVQLEKLATSLSVNEPSTVDYSVRGRVESRVNSGPTMRELPDTWGLNN